MFSAFALSLDLNLLHVTMKQKCILIRFIAISFVFGLILLGCTDGEYRVKDKIVEKTLFMYFPWSGNVNPLTSDFYKNVADMENAIIAKGLDSKRVIVFFATSSSEAEMYEIVYSKGKCTHEFLNEYTFYFYTTVSGLTSILNDVKRFAPAPIYAMTIGSHGMGWVQAEQTRMYKLRDYKYHWEREGALTRWFGGSLYQTDITTLAEAIINANMHMQFVLFDDCYMANVEVAYDMRNATDYLIASTCEVMSAGMPYAMIGEYLLDSEPDYQAICDGFYSFYSNYGKYSYGTLSVIDCTRLDEMASLMKRINEEYPDKEVDIYDLQDLDGYSPTIFFDFGDYVRHLCTDDVTLLSEYEKLLDRIVIYERHTEHYFSSGVGSSPIRTYSGLTISDPFTGYYQLVSVTQKKNTAWWKATHD